MPSLGAKLLGKSREQRHDTLAEPGAARVYVLHGVTAWTSGPPCTFGRVDAWLFKVKCHEMVGRWCSAKYASTASRLAAMATRRAPRPAGGGGWLRTSMVAGICTTSTSCAQATVNKTVVVKIR